MSDKYKIVWSKAALQDLDQIIDYIALQGNVLNARKVAERVLTKIDHLPMHPLRCRIVPELKEFGIFDFRELQAKPYRVFFRIHGRDILLTGILDGRRDLQEILVERVMNSASS